MSNINYDYIKQGDCLELMKELPDKSIDMILCDLPYGTSSCGWDVLIPFDKLWEQYKRIIKNNSAIVLFGTEPFASHLRLSNLKWYKYDWVWQKSKSGSAFTAKYRPVNKHEMICVFSKNGAKTKYNTQMTKGEPYKRLHKPKTQYDINNHKIGFNSGTISENNDGVRYPITVLNFQQKWRRQDQLHPTQKPVELCEYLIKTYTDVGDVVLDNCMGSGSTGVACVNTERRFIGFELEEKYFEIAKERINNAK